MTQPFGTLSHVVFVETQETIYRADAFYVDAAGVAFTLDHTVIVERTVFICAAHPEQRKLDEAMALQDTGFHGFGFEEETPGFPQSPTDVTYESSITR